MVTRVTFIEFTPVRRAVTLDQSRRVQLRTFDPPFPARIRAQCLCHRIGELQSRYLHITGVRRAGNRPSKYRPSPSGLALSLSLPFLPSLTLSLSLRRSRQREKRVPGIPSDKNFNMARREPYRARGLDVRYFRILSNEIAELRATKYVRNITGGESNAPAGDCSEGGKRDAVMSMWGAGEWQELTGLL